MRFLIDQHADGTFAVTTPDLPGWSQHVPGLRLAVAVTSGFRALERRGSVGLTGKDSWTPERAHVPVEMSGDGDVQHLRLSRLFPDPAYQRPLDERRVARMASEYDPALIGVLEVSARDDSTFALVDGQHRWALLRDLSEDDEDPVVPCRVHHGLTVDDEAALFFDIDASRRRLTGWDRWTARRGADDPVVLEIEQVLATLGLRTGIKALAGEPVLRSTSTAEQIHQQGGPQLLSQVLRIALDVWGPDPDALTAGILGGLATFLTCYPTDAGDGRLTHVLQAITPRQLNARAIARREGTPGSAARLSALVMVDLFNAGLRAGRLDPTEIRRDALQRDVIGKPATPKTRPCADCEEPISKKPGPGRWPLRCPTCRDARRTARSAA